MAEIVFSTKGVQTVTAAYEAIQKAQKAAADGVGVVNQKLHLTSVEAKALDRLQQEIAKRNESAQERFARKLEATRLALVGHKDETRLLKQETANLTIEYLRATDGSAKHATAAKRAAEKQRSLNLELEESLALIEDTADAGEGAFGQGMATKITGIGAAIGAVMGPVQLLKTGFGELQKRMEAARSSVEAGAVTENTLKQLADNQREYDYLLSIADRLESSGAAKSRESALQTTFSLGSAGFLDPKSVHIFERLGRQGVVENLGSFAENAKVYATSFGPEEAGELPQVLSKAFRVGKYAVGSTEELMRAAGSLGSIASFAGVSDEESLTAIGATSGAIGTPDKAGVAMEAFIASTEGAKPELGLAGIPLMERALRIQSMNLSAGDLQNLLGRKEAVTGYSKLLKERELYERELPNTQRANTDLSALYEKLELRAPFAGVIDLAARRKAAQNQLHRAEATAQALYESVDSDAVQCVFDQGTKYLGDNALGRGLGGLAAGAVWIASTAAGLGKSSIGRLESDLKASNANEVFTPEEREQGRALIQQANDAREMIDLLRQQLLKAEETNRHLQDVEASVRNGGGLIGTAE